MAVSKTMRKVLAMLARGEGCYILPVTRRALKRHGLITYDRTSSRTDGVVLTDAGRALAEAP